MVRVNCKILCDNGLGEMITEIELSECLKALLDDNVSEIKSAITPKFFAESILGFEDY